MSNFGTNEAILAQNIIILGHADNVSNETLEYLKNKDKYLKIAQWFLDPVSKKGPDYIKNRNRIISKSNLCDLNFLTTSPAALDFNLKNSKFIPNPCDEAFETLNNYNNDCRSDLFFALSHGVHRGNLKSGKIDDREIFINKLIKMNKNIIFDLYGMNNKQPVWGDQFINKISNSESRVFISGPRTSRSGEETVPFYHSGDRKTQRISLSRHSAATF